jgi:hypothetical protein
MSDTPQTDDLSRGNYVVPTEWSERLERERDKTRAELEMWRDGNIMHQTHRDELEKVECERDEARKYAEDYRKLWFLYHSCMTGDPLKPVSNQPLPWEFSK